MNLKMRIYKWIDGVLDFEDHLVESIEHAIDHAEQLVHDGFKVFDHSGHCVCARAKHNHHCLGDHYA